MDKLGHKFIMTEGRRKLHRICEKCGRSETLLMEWGLMKSCEADSTDMTNDKPREDNTKGQTQEGAQETQKGLRPSIGL